MGPSWLISRLALGECYFYLLIDFWKIVIIEWIWDNVCVCMCVSDDSEVDYCGTIGEVSVLGSLHPVSKCLQERSTSASDPFSCQNTWETTGAGSGIWILASPVGAPGGVSDLPDPASDVTGLWVVSQGIDLCLPLCLCYSAFQRNKKRIHAV